jgi:WD40 repeat protein
LAICDLSYNWNKSNIIASSGKDAKIRIWDTRTSQCLKELSDHSHWIWTVEFNKFHDQLLISCSSDCQVNLQSVISTSSAHVTRDEDVNEASPERKIEDGLVGIYDMHEDSVYSIAWSNGDPWIFASLSFDGVVSVNLVPQDHKYAIMGV